MTSYGNSVSTASALSNWLLISAQRLSRHNFPPSGRNVHQRSRPTAGIVVYVSTNHECVKKTHSVQCRDLPWPITQIHTHICFWIFWIRSCSEQTWQGVPEIHLLQPCPNTSAAPEDSLSWEIRTNSVCTFHRQDEPLTSNVSNATFHFGHFYELLGDKTFALWIDSKHNSWKDAVL